MSGCPFKNLGTLTRRGFLKGAGGLMAAASVGAIGTRAAEAFADTPQHSATVPFMGKHQAGIITAQQNHTYFAAFDLITTKREDVIKLLKDWTDESRKLTGGKDNRAADDATGLLPARLTLTFGFGAGLFTTKDGHDRYNLASLRPAALVDMPQFNGDQLVAASSDGDLCVQACADDPQAAFHAIRQLVRLGNGVAQIRWAQTGFLSRPAGNETPRNLQGFKDGTKNPKGEEAGEFVWVGKEGPAWMQGGTYLVARKIRMALEHWDNTNVAFQEQVIGRYKESGAPLGKKNEFDALDLNATDKDGNFIIADNAHVRLGAPESNDGIQILRRGYSYNDGVNFTAERWPPWRQGVEYDAGLFFVCYQRDPRTGFIRIFDKMAKLDALNQFVTHTASGLFACPAGVGQSGYIGERLLAI